MEHHFLNRYHIKGFTLIELLISIAIIGILISVAVASYSTAQKKSRDSRRMSDLKAIQAAIEQYYADSGGSYPTACTTAIVTATYLPAGFPTDPKSGSGYNTNPVDNSIGSSCAAGSYCFCVKLENTTAGNASDKICTYMTGGSGGSYYCVGNLQ